MADNEMMLTFQASVYIEHPLSPFKDPQFLAFAELLHRADVAFANLECAIVDGDEWPAFGSGMGWAGSYLGAPPSMVDELKFLGISALYAANNHVADFAERGILSTMKHLRAGGIPFAGIGASYTEAAEPCYISTAHGRVALIAAADWGPRENMGMPTPWPSGYMGSDDGPRYTSRPGVNLLRYEAVSHVDQAALDELRRISTQLEWEQEKVGRRIGGGQSTQPLHLPEMSWEQDTDTQFHFMGRRFVVSDDFGFSTFPFREDLDRLVKAVSDARRSADVVVVALHDQAHGPGVHEYVRIAAHACIDAGADVFLSSGDIGRGVEIYKGKVFLHGTVGFGFQNSQVRHVPPSLLKRKGLPPDSSAADFYAARAQSGARAAREGGPPPAYVETPEKVLPAVIFDEHCQPTQVRLYPADNLLGTRHRLPVLVEPGSEQFARILKVQAELCADLGTEMRVGDGYGVIDVT